MNIDDETYSDDGDTVCRFDAVELLKFIRIRFSG